MAPQCWHIHFPSLLQDLGAQTRNGGESRKSRSEDCTNPNSNQGQICAPDTKIVITMFADCDYDICLAADKAHSSSRAMSIRARILRDSEIMVSHCGWIFWNNGHLDYGCCHSNMQEILICHWMTIPLSMFMKKVEAHTMRNAYPLVVVVVSLGQSLMKIWNLKVYTSSNNLKYSPPASYFEIFVINICTHIT